MPNENKEEYNGRIDNRRTLTTLNTSKHLNMANRFQPMSHRPETSYTYGGNSHFTKCIYQGNQNGRNKYHTMLLRLSNTT